MCTKQENINDAQSCWNSAQLDEPIFVLKSTDSDAPTTVRIWAELYRAKKLRDGNWNERAQTKYANALISASLMETWKLSGRK